MIYAIKNDGETNEKLVLRYKKMFFQSRLATRIRNKRYAVKAPSKRKVREQAIIRTLYRELNTKVYF
ncbi:MAG: hypothetical protein Q9M94_01205 [Candidatus Gracilibacteria bacterium]|nr:hypothetical protein [Candidatus Gracilibacteria bacterium]MDQ7022595.1 hypothetical protein [Candidatus Gracilibacteria bacterium]